MVDIYINKSELVDNNYHNMIKQLGKIDNNKSYQNYKFYHKNQPKNRIMNRQNYNHGKRGIGQWKN